jgi:hypothetical protein
LGPPTYAPKRKHGKIRKIAMNEKRKRAKYFALTANQLFVLALVFGMNVAVGRHDFNKLYGQRRVLRTSR